MAFRLGIQARVRATDAVVDSIDLGTTNSTGRVLIYTGTQPATTETAATGTLLATIPLGNPAFGNASNAAQAQMATAPVQANASATGNAGWFRVLDRDNRTIFDGAVGTSDAEMILNRLDITSGVPVVVNQITYQVPM